MNAICLVMFLLIHWMIQILIINYCPLYIHCIAVKFGKITSLTIYEKYIKQNKEEMGQPVSSTFYYHGKAG